VVAKANLVKAIAELRAIGGSGVIVTPITYIFEEEPARYKAMLAAWKRINRGEAENTEGEKTPRLRVLRGSRKKEVS
jgi:hypothetical protein